MSNRKLLPQHRDDLQSSGLRDDIIAKAGLFSIDDPKMFRELLRWSHKQAERLSETANHPALAFPYDIDLRNRIAYVRLKPDNPPHTSPSNKHPEGHIQKYLSPNRLRTRAYITPGTREILADANAPLLITEGEKKALALRQLGYAAIGLAGWWGWSFKTAATFAETRRQRLLLPAIAKLPLRGRKIVLIPDADPKHNGQVEYGVGELTVRLHANEAAVVVFEIPPLRINNEYLKRGIDDYIVAVGEREAKDAIERSIRRQTRKVSIEVYREQMVASRQSLLQTRTELDADQKPTQITTVRPDVYLDRGMPGAGKSYCDMLIASKCENSLTAESTHVQCIRRYNELLTMQVVAGVFPKYNKNICLQPARAEKALRAGFAPSITACVNCKSKTQCQYQKMATDAKGADHVIMTHKRLALSGKTTAIREKQCVIVNEDAINAFAPICHAPRVGVGSVAAFSDVSSFLLRMQPDIFDGWDGLCDMRMYNALRDTIKQLARTCEDLTEGAAARRFVDNVPENGDAAYEYLSTLSAIERDRQIVLLSGAVAGAITGDLFNDRIRPSDDPWWDDHYGTTEFVNQEYENATSQDSLKKRAEILKDRKIDTSIVLFAIDILSQNIDRVYWQVYYRKKKREWCCKATAAKLFETRSDAAYIINDATGDTDSIQRITGRAAIDLTIDSEIDRQHPLLHLPIDITIRMPPQAAVAMLDIILHSITLTGKCKTQRVGVLCHKKHHAAIRAYTGEPRNKVDRLKICKIEYFRSGFSRGDNSWIEDVDILIVLGTPRVPENAIHHRLLQLREFHDLLLPVEAAEWDYRYWTGDTTAGDKCTIRTCGYRNRSWSKAYTQLVRDELLQAVGRGRAVCNDGIPVIAATRENIGGVLISEFCGGCGVDWKLLMVHTVRELDPLNAGKPVTWSDLKRMWEEVIGFSPLHSFRSSVAEMQQRLQQRKLVRMRGNRHGKYSAKEYASEDAVLLPWSVSPPRFSALRLPLQKSQQSRKRICRYSHVAGYRFDRIAGPPRVIAGLPSADECLSWLKCKHREARRGEFGLLKVGRRLVHGRPRTKYKLCVRIRVFGSQMEFVLAAASKVFAVAGKAKPAGPGVRAIIVPDLYVYFSDAIKFLRERFCGTDLMSADMLELMRRAEERQQIKADEPRCELVREVPNPIVDRDVLNVKLKSC